MSKRPYVPDRGDIVWLQFNPQASHEQAGHRSGKRGAHGPGQESGLESPEGGEERDRVDRRDRGKAEQASNAPMTTAKRFPYPLHITSPPPRLVGNAE